MTTTALEKRAAGAVEETAPAELTIEQLVEQTKTIQKAMKAVMKEGMHYGTIPGTDKPTLLKPGAEKLCLLFRLDPEYDVIDSKERDTLVSYTVRCTLTHIPTGLRIGSGMGHANSKEAKYRWRWLATEEKPDKKTADAMKAKGLGGWRKKSGNWVWHLRVENEEAMGDANTLLKMACKRALVAAVLNATAASDIFAQDLEDLPPDGPVPLSEGTLGILEDTLKLAAEIELKLWDVPVVLKNASARFGRQIASLDALGEEEAKQIISGAEVWLEQNKRTPDPEPEDENVPAEEVEVMDAGAPSDQS